MTRHYDSPAAGLALSELERAVVEQEGDHAIAAGIRVARHLGISDTDIALAAGLTRTRLYAVIKREEQRDTIATLSRRSVRRLAGAALGPEPLGLVSFASLLRIPVPDATDAVTYLCDRSVAEVLAQSAPSERGPRETWLVPGAAHADWVYSEREVLRWVRQERWSVYIELPEGAHSLVAAGAHHAGPDLATVIAAGTASAVTWDELAIAVGGRDSREALENAGDIWRQIWTAAGEPVPPMRVRELLQPS